MAVFYVFGGQKKSYFFKKNVVASALKSCIKSWTFFSFFRCENYAITLLEQCENLEEVETMLQTRTHDGKTHKDANYIIAILDSRKAFVAHERFQYVLLKKFGEIDLQVGFFIWFYYYLPH